MAIDRVTLRTMPKIELHVHLEGSIRPETVLQLARKHGVDLPAHDVEGLRHWYAFRDFPHFVEVYIAVSRCIKTPDDLEFIGREFLQGQAEQNVLYTEATFTACTIERFCGIPVDEQIDALNRAIVWGQTELGVDMGLVLDIVRGDPVERAMQVVEWCGHWRGRGVCALGLAGFEDRGTRVYQAAFDEAKRLGIPVTAHAGETLGPESIWETLDVTGAYRIGHGVRAVEDPSLVEALREREIVLEVCPTSNVCLGVFPDLASHSIQRLREAGVKVTLNSDDPPMFGTSLTEEWIRCSELFGWTLDDARQLYLEAADAAFLPEEAKRRLRGAWLSAAENA